MGPDVRATLTMNPDSADAAEVFVATCRLTNVGPEPVTIIESAVSSPSLVLEIQDAAGAPVHLPPPPIPPERPVLSRLDPGQDRTDVFSGFLPSWTEAGDYRIRCRYPLGSGDAVVSDWVALRLAR
jgi:hypothetical protein